MTMAKKKDTDGRSNNQPPQKDQFKPGQSGNPKGRPKGAKSKKTTLKNFMEQEFDIPSGIGKKKSVTFREALWKVVGNKALNDRDMRAITLLVKTDQQYFPEYYEGEMLDNPYKKIKELAAEKRRTSGGVLVVHEQQSVEEWTKSAQELREKMLGPDGNIKDELIDDL